MGGLTDRVANIIAANEGNYGSVVASDNGKAASMGKLQWHANRARDLLARIQKADPVTFNMYLKETRIPNEIKNKVNWSSRKLSTSEKKALEKLLNTPVGRKVQDQLIGADVNSYIKTGQGLGIKDTAALSYFSDLYNQSPARAVSIAKKSNKTLQGLHTQALRDPVMSKYKTRRDKAYRSALS